MGTSPEKFAKKKCGKTYGFFFLKTPRKLKKKFQKRG